MTQIVGILNLTPDSFSDGGKYDTPTHALEHLKTLLDQGADIIDIGAESTRPNATPLSSEEEMKRLQQLPEYIALIHERGKKVSVDTRHAQTALFALTHKADMINDVCGGNDDAMLDVIAPSTCHYIIMHSLTVPADKSILIAEDKDATEYVIHALSHMVERCVQHGINTERLILDVGLGFGKNAQQSLQLIWNIKQIQSLNIPLYYGHSRKSCFALFTENTNIHMRDDLTLLASHFLMSQGANYIRVHNVKRHVQLRNDLK